DREPDGGRREAHVGVVHPERRQGGEYAEREPARQHTVNVITSHRFRSLIASVTMGVEGRLRLYGTSPKEGDDQNSIMIFTPRGGRRQARDGPRAETGHGPGGVRSTRWAQPFGRRGP